MIKAKNTNLIALTLIIVLTFSVLCGKLFFKPGFMGFNVYIVSSSSMHPDYPVNSLIVVKYVPIKNLKVGDVVAFKSKALNQGLAFHRITRFENDGFYVKGDQNQNEDNQLILDKDYIGRAVAKSIALGRYLMAIKTPLGFTILLFVPLLLLCLFVFLTQKLKMRA